jgi:hypothetical protein
MAFTTKLALKSDKPELYPGETVLIQHSYNVESKNKQNTYFTLNKDSMLAFGMQPYTANVNNITWGVDDETKDLMLAHIGGDPKTCRITADNKFSSLAFLDKVVKEFNIDPLKEHIFSLDIYQEGDIFVAKIKLRSNIEIIDDEPYPGFKANLEKIFETENELF